MYFPSVEDLFPAAGVNYGQPYTMTIQVKDINQQVYLPLVMRP